MGDYYNLLSRKTKYLHLILLFILLSDQINSKTYKLADYNYTTYLFISIYFD